MKPKKKSRTFQTEKFNKIFLGTVKLGISDYGFSSGSNKVKQFDPIEFLNKVDLLGINYFDTSPRYGQSEKILGRFINQIKKTPFVSSKIDNLKPNNRNSPIEMIESVFQTLNNLNLKKLDICYLHQNEMNIISDPYVQEGLQQLKKKRLINKTGASVYNLEECQYAIECGMYDFIQVPVNVFDVSFYSNFILNNKSDIRIVARSLLLQGLLLNRNQIMDRISSGKNILHFLKKIDKIAVENNLSILELALGFVFTLKNIDHYIIGSTSIENLKNNIRCLKIKLKPDLFDLIYQIATIPKSWSNPRNWV